MPAILISLLKRLGPYAAALALGLGAGAWFVHRLDAASVARAQAAVAQEAAANAAAVAMANAKATAALAAADDRATQAEAALAAERSVVSASVQTEEAQVVHDAAIKGEDGPVAPVLSNALRALRGGQ